MQKIIVHDLVEDLIHPTPRQREFFKAVDSFKYVLYGGAKGGGKSYILRWALVRALTKWAKQGYCNVRVGLFCEDYPALKDRQITKIEKEFPKWLGTLSENNIEGMSFRLKPDYGSGVIALRNLDDVSKFASSEFAIAAVDELTKNERSIFDQFRSIVRWPKIEDTKIIGGTNPGEIGHLWVKKLWIDRQFDPIEDPPAEQFAFVKSLPTDNPHNAQSYLADLQRLPEKLRKAYWDGNWDVFEGQFFTEWDKDKHVVQPFRIPSTWKKYRAYDYGYENPACCKWYAVDYDGRVWVYRELYFPKGHKQDAEQQAQKILDLSKYRDEATGLEMPEIYEYSIADPAIFAPTGMVDKRGGQTLAETFARHGIVFSPGSNRRIDGWGVFHQYLRHDEHTTPQIIYFATCRDSIRTIPALIHDVLNPEDLDTDGEDHAADTDRYFLMSLHERKTSKPKSEIEKKLEQFIKSDLVSAENLNTFYYGSNNSRG